MESRLFDLAHDLITNTSSSFALMVVAFFGMVAVLAVVRYHTRVDLNQQQLRHDEAMQQLDDRRFQAMPQMRRQDRGSD